MITQDFWSIHYLIFKKGHKMYIKLPIFLIISIVFFGCSKIKDDASMLICTSLETNPNLCTETVSKNY